MDICGEHGDEIAYAGRDCPACEQIEDIHRDHQEELNVLETDHAEEVSDLEEKIYELENK